MGFPEDYPASGGHLPPDSGIVISSSVGLDTGDEERRIKALELIMKANPNSNIRFYLTMADKLVNYMRDGVIDE